MREPAALAVWPAGIKAHPAAVAKPVMSRHSLRTLGPLLGLLLMVGAAPAMAANPPTLFTLTSSTPKVLGQGVQKAWPIKISEDNAFDAVFKGGLWLPNPTGGRIYVKYRRHILHDNGTWTWIGTVSTVHGDQSVILTFGKDGVFGLVPQDSGYPLRIMTRKGQTTVVETSAQAMARSAQALGLYSRPDYVIPPRVAPKGKSTAAPIQSAATAAVQAAASGTVTIDVMVAYTPGFVTELGSLSLALTRIQNLIDTTNQAYVTSGVNQQIRLVNTVEVNYPDNTSNQSALDDITGIDENGNPVTIPASLQGIASLRTQYGADLVTLMRSFDSVAQGGCGVGWLIGGGQTPITQQSNVYGYNVVSDGTSNNSSGQQVYCLDTTLAHELGHNMGDAHDRANATESGAYSYSYGYLGNGASGFSTIMAYGTQTTTPLAVFSNPNISICQNTPCGVADSNTSSSADNAHSMNNTAATIAAFEPTMVRLAPTSYTHNDVDGDGKSDLLVYSSSPARLGWWLMNGTSVLGYFSQNSDVSYKVVATGDFNGDGKADIVWEDASNNIYFWISTGKGFVSQFVAKSAAGWSVVGANDVNGDGYSDLLFYASSPARLGWWLMKGVSVFSYNSQTVTSGWRVAATGDFNGDGMGDVIWQKNQTEVAVWVSTGGGFTPRMLPALAPGWSIVGTGDVDGDGNDDLLVYNASPARLGWWLMRDASVVAYRSQYVAGTNWQFVATGDFDGSGKTDLVWLVNGTALYFWNSNGNAFTQAGPVGNYTPGWEIVP